ncbi:hypothetical protein L6258_00505 [Candidatus Parcubacteria bacterium]|nr:hypothetical protein [Candidatus Parcubacteria bacterium]
MAKKKRRDKEVARLSREIELLKAQMASGTPAKEKASTRQAKDKRPAAVAREVTPTLNSTYLKKDLRKSLLLTLAALGILTVLYFR